MKDGRSVGIEGLRATAEGRMDTHVWISDLYPGAPQKYAHVEAGANVDPADHGIPEPFATNIGLQYGGQLSVEEARERLDTLLTGEVDQGLFL